jgi:hypothetical protein
MFAFGGKADMARFYSTFGKSGTQYEIASNTRTPINISARAKPNICVDVSLGTAR